MLAAFLQLKTDFVGDSLVLADVRSRTNHEVVGERGHCGQVQYFDVCGFFILCGAGGDNPGRFFLFIFGSTGNLLGLLMLQKRAPDRYRTIE